MKSKFTLLGIGSLLMLIPMTILLFIEGIAAEEMDRWDDEVVGIIAIFGFLPVLAGVILSAIGGFGLAKPLKDRSVNPGPAVTLGINFIMALPAFFFLFIAMGGLTSAYVSIPFVISIFLFAIAFYVVALIACNKLSEYFEGAGVAKRGYMASMIGLGVGFLILLIAHIAMTRSYYYYDSLDSDFGTVYRIVFTGIFIAFLIGSITTIKGWFEAAREAAAIEENDGEEVVYVETEVAEQIEQPYQQPLEAAPQMPYLPAEIEQPQVDPYTLQLIEYARTLSAEQLEYVLANPAQYEPRFMQICADELARR